MENNEHIELIKKLEEYFTEHYLDITADWGDEIARHERKFQVCCSANERIKILVFGYIIRHNQAYNNLRLVDIFIVLIFIYYSLAYNEERWNWLKLNNLTNLVEAIDDNGDLYLDERMSSGKSSYAMQLYFDITTKDIIVNIPNGLQQINVSSEIRTSILDLAQGKTFRRKRKVRKSRKVRKVRKGK